MTYGFSGVEGASQSAAWHGRRTIPRVLALGALALVTAAAAGLVGCEQEKPRHGTLPVDAQTRISASLNPALEGTIGEFATISADAMPISVEGYGIVANLHGNGSSDMDPNIRQKLVDELIRNGAGSAIERMQNIDAERILSSNDIAVVEVRGQIPPLARKGSRFDLTINALPNSQTVSLENGLLWTTELKVIGLTTQQNDTATIAFGQGQVYIPTPISAIAGDPKAAEPTAIARSLRSGHVLGGGVVATDRHIRLQLYSPNPGMTRAIEYTINARFPARDKTAAADDEVTVSLSIPAEYNLDPVGFIDAVKHLYLRSPEPGFIEKRAAIILESMKEPDAPRRDLALALQGLGRSILPGFIQPNYTSTDPEIRFWCARAGAGMQDIGGILALQEMVVDKSSPYRERAVHALVETTVGRDTVRASMTLAEMLKSPNIDERISAYKGLLAMRSRLIKSYSVPSDSTPREATRPGQDTRPTVMRKFIMDVVPADCSPVIYVQQADEPRIAFIGRPIELASGAVYVSKDRLLTVVAAEKNTTLGASGGGRTGGTQQVLTATSVGAANAPAADPKDNVTLYYRSPTSSRTVNIKVGPSMPELVARAAWEPDPRTVRNVFEPDAQGVDDRPFIGASYQRIAEMLATMCRDNLLDARFVQGTLPPPILTPHEIVTSGRVEGSTRPPETQPAEAPGRNEGTTAPHLEGAPPATPH